ncbi:MAG: insulinase family protein [Lachnospiraceae bacterium]|nr:insulinase family protein [Lachnospiraceae bacterium]
MIKTNKLSNGITLVMESMPYMQSVSFGVFVKIGSANETYKENGIAHMMEHMLFKGTTNYSAKELADKMVEIGGNLNAYTAKECTGFYVRTLDKHLNTAIEIIGDMLNNSLIDKKDVVKEKRVVLDEIDMYMDSPEDMVHEILQQKIWNKHPLGYIISGSKQNVRSFDEMSIKAFMDKHYIAQNIYISIAGRFNEIECIETLERHFSKVKTGKDIEDIEKPVYNRVAFSKFKDVEQVHVNIAFDSISIGDDKRYALAIVNAVLGGNVNSRLFQRIREELGLTYSIYSYSSCYSTAGLFHIYATMNANQVERVIEEIKKVVEEFTTNGITKRELEVAKEQTLTEMIISYESNEQRMEANSKHIMFMKEVPAFEEITDKIMSVTVEDVNEYVKKYLDFNTASIGIIGNTKEFSIKSILNKWRKI